MALGCHPKFSERFEHIDVVHLLRSIDECRKLGKFVAVGEFGLDMSDEGDVSKR